VVRLCESERDGLVASRNAGKQLATLFISTVLGDRMPKRVVHVDGGSDSAVDL